MHGRGRYYCSSDTTIFSRLLWSTPYTWGGPLRVHHKHVGGTPSRRRSGALGSFSSAGEVGAVDSKLMHRSQRRRTRSQGILACAVARGAATWGRKLHRPPRASQPRPRETAGAARWRRRHDLPQPPARALAVLRRVPRGRGSADTQCARVSGAGVSARRVGGPGPCVRAKCYMQ
jgi:hypothetical protein